MKEVSLKGQDIPGPISPKSRACTCRSALSAECTTHGIFYLL